MMPLPGEQRVQIFGLGMPSPGTPKERRRYRVKWRIDGRDRTRAVRTKAEAERVRSRLQMAAIDGEAFDLETGLPMSWVARPTTWWSWSRQWLELKWPHWSGHSRRSAVESLVAITPFMVRYGAPAAPPLLADWLRLEGYRVGHPHPSGPELSWLERWSVPLTEIVPGILEATLTAATTRRDGQAMSPEVVRRRRTALNAVLRAAVRRDLIGSNPMERMEWRVPERNLEVDVSTLPSFGDVCEIVDHVAAMRSAGARYAALFAMVGMAGAAAVRGDRHPAE
jgi:hypothetical protein